MSQMRLGSGVAVAVAPIGPSPGTSICPGCGPQKDQKKKKEHRKQALITAPLLLLCGHGNGRGLV